MAARLRLWRQGRLWLLLPQHCSRRSILAAGLRLRKELGEGLAVTLPS